jgi:glycosyltransferase involved in cell wall biosynthesis
MSLHKPIRVLHSFGALDVGGLETWLMNILRLRSDEIQFDFFLGKLGGVYEKEAISYGCRMYLAPPIRQIGKNMRFLEEVLTNNKYDVFHVHGDEFLGDAVKVAAKAGVPVRVVHSHNTKLARGKKGFEMKIRAIRQKTLERYRILHYATDIIACGIDAGWNMMGQSWEKDHRSRVLYCGVSLDQFKQGSVKWTRSEFRKAYGIPENAIVVGHVGSMGPTSQKNHPFILKIFAELARMDQRYFLYMAGDGPHRPELEQKVKEMGLQSRVKMPGLCDDVPSLMVHGFDIFLFPSFWEGLPVVGLEAVSSGIFTVCSDSITKEFTDFFSERITTLSLDASPLDWAKTVAESVHKRMTPKEGITLLEKSPFSIQSSLNSMLDIYKHRLQEYI